MGAKDFASEVSSLLDKLNASNEAREAAGDKTVAPVVKGVEPDEAQKRLINNDAIAQNFWDICAVNKEFQRKGFGTDKALQEPREFLRKKDANGNYIVKRAELEVMLRTLLQKGAAGFNKSGKGTPIEEWGGKQAGAVQYGLGNTIGQQIADPSMANMISKDMNTASGTSAGQGGYLIRTDLEPTLYEIYLRYFPALDYIASEQANGLVHTFNVRTAPPSASTIAELGDFSGLFTNSVLGQRNAPVAILIAPVGVGLKFQYAVPASGMGYNVSGPDNMEVTGALIGLAKKNQSLFLQGNANSSANTGTIDTEDGLYDANGYTGLRQLLKGSSNALNRGTDTYVKTVNRAVTQVLNAGGDPADLFLMMSPGVLTDLNAELIQYLKLNDGAKGPFDSALGRFGITTVSGWDTKINIVPANTQGTGLGYYTYSAAETEDIFVLDASTMSRIYLGSPSPTILELPMGYNNKLSNVYIPFMMNGLALKIPEFNRKIRTAQVVV